jgi:hypothetical protein
MGRSQLERKRTFRSLRLLAGLTPGGKAPNQSVDAALRALPKDVSDAPATSFLGTIAAVKAARER